MKKKLLAIISVVLVASCSLFAADSLSLYNSFSESLSDPEKAISYYDSMKSQVEKEKKKAYKSLDKAIEAKNADKVNAAYVKLRELSSYCITKVQSDELLTSIISSGSNADQLKWLYENSSYYHPVLTLKYIEENGSRLMSWARSISAEPGSTIELPDMNSYGNGIFKGWGITADAVTYEAGTSITMPATDQTLYAIFGSGIVFSDSMTGFKTVIEDIKAGDTVDVPAVTADDESAIFAGWADGAGDYIANDDTEYTVDGKGTVFHALWQKAEFTDVRTRYYSLDSIPQNTQIELDFTLNNRGTEKFCDMMVSVSSADDGIAVLKDHASVANLSAGTSVDFRGFTFVAKTKGNYTLTLTAVDPDGNTWNTEVPINVI